MNNRRTTACGVLAIAAYAALWFGKIDGMVFQAILVLIIGVLGWQAADAKNLPPGE